MEREISERKKYWRVRKRSLGVRDRDSGKNRKKFWRDLERQWKYERETA